MELSKELTEKQKKIMDAAVDILTKDGLERVTMKRIARRIGVTDGALYNHFASKKEIFTALHAYLRDVYIQVMTTIHSQLTTQEQEGAEQENSFLDELITLYRDHFFADPRLVYLIRNYSFLFKNYPELMEDMRQVRGSFRELFQGKVAEGIENGQFSENMDADSLMYIVNGSFLALYIDLLNQGKTDTLDERTQLLWSQLKQLLYR